MLIITTIIGLLLILVYYYASDTFQHMGHSLNMVFRLLRIILMIGLITGLLVWSLVRFGETI
jgi:hypothetical protein